MLILEMLFNEKLVEAEVDLKQANSGNIIELCRNYMGVLREYREDLYKLRGSPGVNLQQSSLLARELVEQIRKAIRSTVEITTLKLNQTEMLLDSFTCISGGEAVDTFNQLKYKGLDNWAVGPDFVDPPNNAGQGQLPIDEAVEAASFLRREAYINDKTTFFKQVRYSDERSESIG